MDLLVNNLNIFIWGSVGITLAYGLFLVTQVLAKPAGDVKMLEIAKAIQEGANAYLRKQYTVIAGVAVVLAGLMYYALNLNAAIGFVIGAFLSALAGFI